MPGMESELDTIKTEELVHYVVGEHEREAALAVLDRFRYHPAASHLLRSYYLDLPEAREEMATDIRVVARKQGNFLFALRSVGHSYFYLCSADESMYLGETGAGINDGAVLQFFGFSSVDEFAAQIPDSYEEWQTLASSESGHQSTCIACGVGSGELHIFGCPVELCPWCESQLSGCNCRFDKLGVDTIEDDVLLDRFEELLEEQGRVAFKAEQNPSYPTAGPDTLSAKTGA